MTIGFTARGAPKLFARPSAFHERQWLSSPDPRRLGKNRDTAFEVGPKPPSGLKHRANRSRGLARPRGVANCFAEAAAVAARLTWRRPARSFPYRGSGG